MGIKRQAESGYIRVSPALREENTYGEKTARQPKRRKSSTTTMMAVTAHDGMPVPEALGGVCHGANLVGTAAGPFSMHGIRSAATVVHSTPPSSNWTCTSSPSTSRISQEM